jgi:hypothetical protein
MVIDKHSLITDTLIPSEIYAVSFGYNQLGRNVMNRIAGRPIEGDIAFFKVGKNPTILLSLDSLLFNGQSHILAPCKQ